MDYTPKEPNCSQCPAFLICSSPTVYMKLLGEKMRQISIETHPADVVVQSDKIIDSFVDSNNKPLEEHLMNFLHNENHRAYELSVKTGSIIREFLGLGILEKDTLNIPKG